MAVGAQSLRQRAPDGPDMVVIHIGVDKSSRLQNLCSICIDHEKIA